MTTMDYGPFYKSLAHSYMNRAREAQDKYQAAFDVAVAVIKAIAEAESDGSSISRLKEIGEVEAKRLLAAIDT